MPCFFARLLIVSPAACPSRSCSNSSTLPLLSIPESFHPGLTGWAKSDDQSGPNQSIELKAGAGCARQRKRGALGLAGDRVESDGLRRVGGFVRTDIAAITLRAGDAALIGCHIGVA